MATDWEQEQAFWAAHQSVERFNFEYTGGYSGSYDMVKNETGDWVRADDFRKALEARKDPWGEGGIGWAVEMLTEHGKRVQRAGWNGKGMWLEYVPGSDEMQGHVVIHPVSGGRIPWVCSQADLLADDWQVAEEGRDDG